MAHVADAVWLETVLPDEWHRLLVIVKHGQFSWALPPIVLAVVQNSPAPSVRVVPPSSELAVHDADSKAGSPALYMK